MKRAALGVFTFLAVLAASELAARHVMPVVPRSDMVPRNPYRFRGWPEFTCVPPSSNGLARVVLISNSQGYTGEMPANRIYSDQLERMLTERRAAGFTRWEVMNWSFDGVTSMEYVLLAARARQQRPDLVVAAVGVADFMDLNLTRSFARCRTDLPRLVTRSEIAAYLPTTFYRRHGRAEDLLTLAAWDRCALLRSRDYMWSWMDQTWSGLQSGLYAPFLNYNPWRLKVKKRGDLGRAPWLQGSRGDVVYTARARVLLEEFLDQLRQLSCPSVVIAVPHGAPEGDPILDDLERFRADLVEQAAARGLLFWNLADALPKQDFLDSVHFRRENQRRFAELLAEKLPPLLAR
jgi:hypothetical protein